MACPRCGFDADAGASECPGCGVIFAKLQPRESRIASYVIEEERIADGRIGRRELMVLGIGLGLAVAAHALPFTRFIFSALVTLFHELGHAIAGWLFGHASLPAFDLVYGGGLTHYGIFRRSIVIAVGCVFIALLWIARQNRRTFGLIAAIFAIWLFVAFREWRRETVMASAGHLAEVILSAILFYKALAGVGWRAPEFERPLGAFVAFFVQLQTMTFAWRLTHDPAFLTWYRGGKGGALMNDLEVIALNLQIWLGVSPGIEGVARGLFLFSFVPLALALLWYFKRATWHRVMRSLRTADA